jgi:hypothetical protein
MDKVVVEERESSHRSTVRRLRSLLHMLLPDPEQLIRLKGRDIHMSSLIKDEAPWANHRYKL